VDLVLIVVVAVVVVLSVLNKLHRGTLFFWRGRADRDT
jgi:hypothetical protein